MSILHIGQVRCSSSHGSMQLLWNSCLKWGRIIVSASGEWSSRGSMCAKFTCTAEREWYRLFCTARCRSHSSRSQCRSLPRTWCSWSGSWRWLASPLSTIAAISMSNKEKPLNSSVGAKVFCLVSYRFAIFRLEITKPMHVVEYEPNKRYYH